MGRSTDKVIKIALVVEFEFETTAGGEGIFHRDVVQEGLGTALIGARLGAGFSIQSDEEPIVEKAFANATVRSICSCSLSVW